MITIFTTAKPFEGRTRIRQMNALRSWKALHPEIEVMLFGKGSDYAEVAADLGLAHVPEVATTEAGTPLVGSMFSLAQQRARHPFLAYINCDVIMTGGLVRAAALMDEKMHGTPFMMVGQRLDMDLDEEMVFGGDGAWEQRLMDRARQARLHPPTGCDYFLFRAGTFKDLPPLVVGRAYYDNWLIYFCRLNGIRVVDASECVMAVHQNHDYSHLSMGQDEAWTGHEALSNLAVSGGRDSIFTIVDADLRLTSRGLSRNRCRGDWYRFLESGLILRKASALGRTCLLGIRKAHGLYTVCASARKGAAGA